MKRLILFIALFSSLACSGQFNRMMPVSGARATVVNSALPAQNYVPWSRDFSQWTNASGNITITTNNSNDVTGLTTMNLITVNNTGGGDVNLIFSGLASSTTYYLSFDAKTGTNTGAEFQVWDWDHFTTITSATSYIGSISSTVSRFQTSFTTHASNSQIKLIIYNSPFTAGTISIGRVQIALNAAAPYVETSGTPVL